MLELEICGQNLGISNRTTEKLVIVLNIRLQWDISSLFGTLGTAIYFKKILISGLLSITMMFAAKKGFGI